MRTFNLTILAADNPFYEGPCESLIIPSLNGKYGILPRHCNMIIALIPGTLIFRPSGQSNQIVAVSHGLVKVENNEVLVLVDSIERREDIDDDRAIHAAYAAREALFQSKNAREYRLAQAKLERALNRLRFKGIADLFKDK